MTNNSVLKTHSTNDKIKILSSIDFEIQLNENSDVYCNEEIRKSSRLYYYLQFFFLQSFYHSDNHLEHRINDICGALMPTKTKFIFKKCSAHSSHYIAIPCILQRHVYQSCTKVTISYYTFELLVHKIVYDINTSMHTICYTRIWWKLTPAYITHFVFRFSCLHGYNICSLTTVDGWYGFFEMKLQFTRKVIMHVVSKTFFRLLLVLSVMWKMLCRLMSCYLKRNIKFAITWSGCEIQLFNV